MAKRDRRQRMETGPDSAGQSGATQQISDTPIADSESVEELVEEGNAFEANYHIWYRERERSGYVRSDHSRGS